MRKLMCSFSSSLYKCNNSFVHAMINGDMRWWTCYIAGTEHWTKVIQFAVYKYTYLLTYLFSRGGGVRCINPFSSFFLFFFNFLYCFIILYAWAPSLLLNK